MTGTDKEKVTANLEFAFEKIRDGKVIDAFKTSAKLTKSETENAAALRSQTIIIVIDPINCEEDNGCGCPKITIEHQNEFIPEVK